MERHAQRRRLRLRELRESDGRRRIVARDDAGAAAALDEDDRFEQVRVDGAPVRGTVDEGTPGCDTGGRGGCARSRDEEAAVERTRGVGRERLVDRRVGDERASGGLRRGGAPGGVARCVPWQPGQLERLVRARIGVGGRLCRREAERHADCRHAEDRHPCGNEGRAGREGQELEQARLGGLRKAECDLGHRACRG